MKNYICLIRGNVFSKTLLLPYRDALRAAEEHGEHRDGETVTVFDKEGRPVSCALYVGEEHRYIRIQPPDRG